MSKMKLVILKTESKAKIILQLGFSFVSEINEMGHDNGLNSLMTTAFLSLVFQMFTMMRYRDLHETYLNLKRKFLLCNRGLNKILKILKILRFLVSR